MEEFQNKYLYQRLMTTSNLIREELDVFIPNTSDVII